MSTAFGPGIYRRMFSLPECWPRKFLVLGGIVVVGIPLSTSRESEAVYFRL